MKKAQNIVVGGASGYWGEAPHATRQLLTTETLDFLAYDYLAEITMSIMARARAKDPQLGYATDFVTSALALNLEEIARQNVKVISNAGGVNPQACGEAVRKLIEVKGLDLKVAIVTGDDLSVRAGEFADKGVIEMFSGEAFPDPSTVASINAYLGAFPIAGALDNGADIVVTGRCVDSAVTLGACIHALGWKADEYDRLAAGSLAGHLLECGPQATGGNFTDWRKAGDIAEIGYPIAEIASDGGMIITKPAGTTGVVAPASVGEQMLYEIGDPQAYTLPDVVCDFSEVTLEDEGLDRVAVRRAKGRAPTGSYKVSATYTDGFRAGQLFTFSGFDARDKAVAFGEASFARARNALQVLNAPDFDETSMEVMGGATGNAQGYQEITLKLAVRHRDARAVGLFLKEMTGLALATPAGMSAFAAGGRSRPSPVVRLYSFLLDKSRVPVSIDFESKAKVVVPPAMENEQCEIVRPSPPPPVTSDDSTVSVPLIRLAFARSGDKGDKANIGVIARQPEFLPWIWATLTEEAVAKHFSHFLKGGVDRYYLPGSHAINFVLHEVLGGGGVVSLRNDAQGKSYAQMLLAHPISISEKIASTVDPEAGS